MTYDIYLLKPRTRFFFFSWMNIFLNAGWTLNWTFPCPSYRYARKDSDQPRKSLALSKFQMLLVDQSISSKSCGTECQWNWYDCWLMTAFNVIDSKYLVLWICMASHMWQEQTGKLPYVGNWEDTNNNSKM